jgi:uncharacterized membrane protein YhaH (DUF805 family)
MKAFLAIECAAVFVGIPVLLIWTGAIGWIVLLALMTTVAFIYLRRHHDASPPTPQREALTIVILRFAALCAALTLIIILVAPERLFALPRDHPRAWLLLIVAYPLISVWPQELIYRAFFFERYKALFGRALPIASAVAFGFLHIIYGNPVALALTLAGGIIFSTTYRRSRSLATVWVEHSLYGLFLFTIGLGDFFQSGRFVSW